MAKVVLNRSTPARNVARNRVKPGEVFSIVRRNGDLGKKQYLALASNGRLYSMNISDGKKAALASSANGTKNVTVIGSGVIQATNFATWDHRRTQTVRKNVKSGQLFQHAGSPKTYMALGTLKDGRFASVDIAKPLAGDYAVGSNANSNVTIVGEAAVHASITA